ncbi:MAG: ferrous iron transport protein B, partial [Clostridia bacterium]|nr:ferrous iron transport protein B [Clostridia bacterium]
NDRYNYIERILKKCFNKKSTKRLTVSDKIDRIVTNRWLALPVFAFAMFAVYYISIGSIGNWTVSFMNDTMFGEWIIPAVTSFLEGIGCAAWLVELIAEGIVGGVGSVLGFVPQMMILFFLLSVLEDCGYMSRVAFIMDKIFRKFGLSGKSFIPLLVATGCGVPGIMASRTVEQERDRRMTVMTTGFIPCGAKMPIVGMIAAALFGGGAWVATLAYFIGIGAVAVSGLILKKTKPFAGEVAPFVMELPAYHLPVASNILRTTWERGWDFIKRAGTVILAASVIIWTLNSLSFEGGFHYISPSRGGASILENIGGAIKWVFMPLGFGNWQSAVATILGLMAKEQVVGTFGTLSSMANADLAMEGDVTMYATIAKEFFGGSGLAGMSFMIFNLLCAPCVAAMGAIKREMNSWKWTAGTITYMCEFAYAISLMVYQFGTFITSGIFTIWTAFALAVFGLMVYLLVRKDRNKR